MAALINVKRIKQIPFMSADFHKDPARVKSLEDQTIEKLRKLWDIAKTEIEDAFQTVTEGKHYAAVPGFDQDDFDTRVEAIIQERVIDPSHDVFTGADAKAYRHGREFAQGFLTVELGDTPAERRKEWTRIEKLVKKNDMDMARIGSKTQSEIRRVIGDGIKNERDFRDIQKDIMARVDVIGVTRSATMVRTETQRAVNDGVKDTYEKADVTVFERLEALDEKTCTDWEFNIGGRIYRGCAAINGQQFTREEADQVDEQTHPNCRGTWIPVVDIPTMDTPTEAPKTEPEPAPEAPPEPAPAAPISEAPLLEPEPLRPDEERMTRDEVLVEWEKVHATQNYESALVLDADGWTVLSKRGEKHSVGFYREEMDKIVNVKGGAYFIHNHPSGGAFSPNDYKMARDADVAEMRAIGNRFKSGEQFRYVLTRDASKGWEPFPVVKHYFDKYHKEIMDQNIREINAGKLTIQEAETHHYHDVWTRVAAETGVNYRREQLR